MNQQCKCISNKVSLNRNAHKIRLCIYQLVRIVTRGNRCPRPWLCIPPGAVVQYSWIQCSRPLYRQHLLQVTGIRCSYFILFCWTDGDHQSSILGIRVFRAYVNAGLCTLISGAPWRVSSSSAQSFASGRGTSSGMKAIAWLGNLACSLAWLSLTTPCWLSTFPFHAAAAWAMKKQLWPDLWGWPRRGGYWAAPVLGSDGAGPWDVGAPHEGLPMWVLCLLCF